MRLLFCGNCQVQALSGAYRSLVAPQTGDVVTFVYHPQVHEPAARQAAALADVVIDQATQMPRPKQLEDINPAAARFCVPAVGAPFLWPYAGTGGPGSFRRYGSYNPFGADHGDSWLARRMGKPFTEDGIVDEYVGLDIVRAAHLDRRLDMAMGVQERLDAATGFAFAPLIAGHFRTERLFRTPYHPGLIVMRHMMLGLLAQLGTAAAVTAHVERTMRSNLFHPKEMAIHPGVAAHFGLTYADAGTQYRFHSETIMTFADWVRRFVRCEAYPAVSAAVEAVLAGKAGAAALLAEAAPALPNSPLVRLAEAVLLVKEGRHAEARPRLEALAAAWPALPGIDRYLTQTTRRRA